MQRDDSRAVRLAARAARASESELEQRLAQARVQVSIEPRLPGAMQCAEVLITTLQRGPGAVSLDPDRLGPAELERLEHAANQIRPERPIRIQADRLLDVATGDTVVGLRDTRPDGPCLACMLPPPAGASPVDALVALGIPAELARAPGDTVVDEQIIAAAPDPDARAILTAQRGTPICGLLRAAGLTDVDAGDYMPSIPFVSQQAACLGVGRLVAIATGIDAELPNFVQYDALLGPTHALKQHRAATPGCACQQRAGIIDQVRRERRAGTVA